MTGDFDHVGRAQPPSWLQGQQPLSHSSDLGLSELGGLNGVPERQRVEQLGCEQKNQDQDWERELLEVSWSPDWNGG